MGCADSAHTRADDLAVDAGDEATACDALRESHVCPDGVNAESNLRMLSEEGALFCEVECIQRRSGERIRTGAYVLENVSTAGLRVQGEYAQNERQGVWTTTTRCEVSSPDCRVIVQQEAYDAGTRHGAFREFWGDGSPRVVGAFHRGAEHGSWVRTTRSGTPAKLFARASRSESKSTHTATASLGAWNATIKRDYPTENGVSTVTTRPRLIVSSWYTAQGRSGSTPTTVS